MATEENDEGFTSVPGRAVQTASSLFCWVVAMAGAYFAPRGGGSTALDEIDNSFRARFLLPLLPVSIFMWTLVYIALCNCLKKNCRPTSIKLFTGYPGWSYMAGVCHGLVFLPLIFGLAVMAHLFEFGISSTLLPAWACLTAQQISGRVAGARPRWQVILCWSRCTAPSSVTCSKISR